MANLYWYIGISIIGVVSTACIIYKQRHVHKASTLFVAFLLAGSWAWIGEFIVLGLFNSYAYKTGLFEDPWAQNLLGHLLVNTALYPAVAIAMVAYSLRYKWILFVAASFTLIEVFFVKLGIYEQHWWRYYMTFIAVILFLSIFKKWFAKMHLGCTGLFRALTYYFIAIIIIHFPAPVLLLMAKQYYRLDIINNLVGNLYLTSILIIFFYHMAEAILLVVVTCMLKKWYFKLLPIVFSLAVQSILVKMNILIIKENWHLIYTLILYELFIAAFILVEKYTLRPDFYRRRY